MSIPISNDYAMKATPYFLILILSLYFPAMAFSQAEKDETLILGVWILDMEQQESAIRSESPEKLENLGDAQRESLQQLLESRVYIFYPDGKFEAIWASGGGSSNIQGEWGFSGSVLTFKTEGGNSSFAVNFDKGMVWRPVRKTDGILNTIYLKALGE
jgi:hypothetical protein